MRWIIRLLVIFVAAIVVAIYGMSNPSYVSFFIFKTPEVAISTTTSQSPAEGAVVNDALPPSDSDYAASRYDIRLTFFAIAVVLGLGVLYMLLRFLAGLLNVPGATRRWRALRRERGGHIYLNEAILEYLAGRYSRAVKSAQKALKSYEKNRSRNEKTDGTIEFGTLAYLIAAASAHHLQNKQDFGTALEKSLQLAEKSHLSDAPDAVRLQQVQWLIKDNNPQAARQAIAQLDPGVARRIATLQMQLQIDRLEKTPLPALHTVKQLVKHKAYEPLEAQRLIAELACETLDTASNAQQISELLSQLDPKDQKNPIVVAHAATKYAQYGDAPNACALIASCWNDLSALPADLRQNLLLTLDTVITSTDSPWIKRLEQAHTQLPDDPMLTYLAGRICEHHQLTGRAQLLLEQTAQDKHLPNIQRQRAWLLLAQLAEKNGEGVKANACYKAAALLLKP